MYMLDFKKNGPHATADVELGEGPELQGRLDLGDAVLEVEPDDDESAAPEQRERRAGRGGPLWPKRNCTESGSPLKGSFTAVETMRFFRTKTASSAAS